MIVSIRILLIIILNDIYLYSISISINLQIILGANTPLPGGKEGTTIVQSLINKDGFKLIIGSSQDTIHTSPFYPNSSYTWSQTDPATQTYCGGSLGGAYPIFDTENQTYTGACLYNIFDDPYEYNDISSQYPEIVSSLSVRMKELTDRAYSPDRGKSTSLSCMSINASWSGFLGPFLFHTIDESKEQKTIRRVVGSNKIHR